METKLTQHFLYNDQDFISHVCRSEECSTCTGLSKFDIMLRSRWTAKMGQGLFRYHLGDLQTRILPGSLQFVAQLNILRAKERRKPQEIASIRQNFNGKQFNFNKIKSEEHLFDMIRGGLNQIDVACQLNEEKTCSHQGPNSELDRMLVVINVSPLEFGHCLFVPEPMKCLPQILTPPAIKIGIESVFLSSHPGFRVGFNSLGAFASVNHLHLHGYYLDCELRIESAPTEPLIPQVGIHRLTEFPYGFLFYTEGQDLQAFVGIICQLTDYFVDRNTAHNLFFTRGCPPGSHAQPITTRSGVRVIVWPRKSCFGAKKESAFNVALCELAGHFPFKSRKDFDIATQDDVKSIIHKFLLSEKELIQLQFELGRHFS